MQSFSHVFPKHRDLEKNFHTVQKWNISSFAPNLACIEDIKIKHDMMRHLGNGLLITTHLKLFSGKIYSHVRISFN